MAGFQAPRGGWFWALNDNKWEAAGIAELDSGSQSITDR
jgi:hypothetical protein